MVNKATISDQRLVRARITLHLKRIRTKLIMRKEAYIDVIRVKTEEFRIALKNKLEVLGQEENEDIEKMDGDITKLITEAAIEVGTNALSNM